jgi:hypothetical protein
MILQNSENKQWYLFSNMIESKVAYPQDFQCSMPQTCAFPPSMKLSQQSAYKGTKSSNLLTEIA